MLGLKRLILSDEDRYTCKAYQDLDLGYYTYRNKTTSESDQYQSKRYPGKDYHSQYRLKQQVPLKVK